ncbi:MAG: thioesterase family protein [Pseudomonadota bacterium]
MAGDYAAPLALYEGRVRAEWIDEFGHVNIAHYLTICDQANWGFWTLANAPEDMQARGGHEYVILENHVRYLDELALDTEIRVTTQLLEADDKRCILFHRVWRVADGALSATNEVKMIGFDLEQRRVEAWRPVVRARLEAILAAHAPMERPAEAGLGIDLKRR